MWWLSLVLPLIAVLVYVLTGRPDRRREREIERWRAQRGVGHKREIKPDGTAYRGGKEVVTTVPRPGRVPRRVNSLPGPLARVLETTGGGARVAYFEVCAKLAYLAVMGADPTQGSDHVTVVAKLDEPGPTFTVRPLPIEEGVRIPNTGVQFKKDPEFMACFLVEPTLEEGVAVSVPEALAKPIRKWLSPPLREALLDFPDAWLRVDGKAKTMAFTAYGPADAERIAALIAAADIVFAEYGAGGGPSLVGDEEEDAEPSNAPPEAPKTKKAGGAQPARSDAKG